MILTAREIRDLAEVAGFSVEPLDADAEQAEVVVIDCPVSGIQDDDGNPTFFNHVAYFQGYPNEGAFPLGEQLDRHCFQNVPNEEEQISAISVGPNNESSNRRQRDGNKQDEAENWTEEELNNMQAWNAADDVIKKYDQFRAAALSLLTTDDISHKWKDILAKSLSDMARSQPLDNLYESICATVLKKIANTGNSSSLAPDNGMDY